MVHFILYVSDQARSSQFYRQLLRREPLLDVPGMTEFELEANCKLGLMPNAGIVRLLGDAIESPASAGAIPRCELYYFVENIDEFAQHALQCGAKLLSPVAARNWGDTVGYFADPDGHILAFAAKTAI